MASRDVIQVVRFNCAGLDVHSKLIVATVGITDRSTMLTEYHQNSFGTNNPDLESLAKWLESFGCLDVCMESTGKYWIPIWNVLEEHKMTICLAHPKYTKAIKGKKTDKKDSKWICDLYKHDLVRGSFIPPKDIRELRELARYYRKLIAMQSSESLRYQNCLTVSNFSLQNIFSDPMGKSAMAVAEEVLNSDKVDEEKLRKLIHGNCRNKDKIMEVVNGCRIESDAKFKMQTTSAHIKELDEHINACYLEMTKRASKYFPQFLQIAEIKGIGLLSSILIISEIGVDMSVWENARQLTCWAGLTPGNNESANKKKSTRITKAGQYLKPLLVQCALASIKDKDGYFGIKYARIKKRRGHKKAIIAIARMMLICIYHMIETGEEFKPSDYDELMNPKPKPGYKITIESAITFLQSSGYDVSTIQRTKDLHSQVLASGSPDAGA
ncbi:IS110 family transposase [Galactobacillus timonensis]|uniref:IS110 family transposase n=1 Tax=Galactobacillus timonensis TaxID=2041840 RepID=UPI000C8151E2|nr:IS110 family transposase [Galactobacillus timonensis]